MFIKGELGYMQKSECHIGESCKKLFQSHAIKKRDESLIFLFLHKNGPQ